MKLIIEYQYFTSSILYFTLFKNSYIEFEICENYQKAGFRNRLMLASPSGPVSLSIPLAGGRNTRVPVSEVKIDYRQPWQSHHLKTLKNYYNRSPWFDLYLPELEDLFRQQPELLISWNRICFEWICKKMNISAKITETGSYQKILPPGEYFDWRGKILPSNYTSVVLPGAVATPAYHQVYEAQTGFLPNLSVLDLLFCEGPRSARLPTH